MQNRQFAFIGMSLIFFITPFMNGLYFNEDFYIVELLLLLFFLITFLFLFLKKEVPLLKQSAVLVLLPIILLISFFKAATPLGGLNEVLRWTSYCCFFYLMCYVTDSVKYKRYTFYLILLTGFAISIHAFTGYSGLVALEGNVIAGRLAGVFQYPNTYAALVGGLWLFSVHQISHKSGHVTELIIIGIPIVPFFLGLLLTESRGVWIILPFVWIVGLLLLKSTQQFYYILNSFISIILSILVYSFSPEGSTMIWLYLGLAAITFLSVLIYSEKRLKGRSLFKKIHPAILPISFLLFLLAGGLDFYFRGILFRLLPLKIQDRLQSFDTFSERLIMAKDALKASKDSLLLGFGGEGWSVLYTKYQSLPYQTTNLHNGYIEWLINAGILGLLSFLSVFTYLFIALIQRNKEDDSRLQYAVFLFLLMIFTHSFIDFNFSYGSIWFFILTIFAIGLPRQPELLPKTGLRFLYKKVIGVIFVLLICFSLVTSYRFHVSNRLFDQAVKDLTVGDKLELVDQALQYNKNDIEKWNTLGLLLLKDNSLSSNNNEYVRKIALKLISLEPTTSRAYLYAIQLLEEAQMLEEAAAAAQAAIEIDSFNPMFRQKNIQLQADMALLYVKTGHRREAEKIATHSIHEFDRFQQDVETINKKIPNERFNSRNFVVTEEVKYLAMISFYINQNFDQVITLAKELSGTKNESLQLRLDALAFVSTDLSTGSPPYNPDGKSEDFKNLINEFYNLSKGK